jgi:hypothetical protein
MAEKKDPLVEAEMSLKMASMFARVFLVGRMIGPELLDATLPQLSVKLDKAFEIAERIIERSTKGENF